MATSAKIALPARWGAVQRRKNTLLLWAMYVAAAAIRRVPRAAHGPLATLLGRVAYVLSWPWQRLWLEQIELALGASNRPRRVLRDMFVHLARSVLELGHLQALAVEAQAAPGSLQLLERAARHGGAVVVSGHIGHWELLAQWGAQRGLPIVSVAKPLYDPRLTAWVEAERCRSGLRLIWRGRNDGPLALLKALKDHQLLALLIDQDTGVPGEFVPFFGRLAHTPSAPARLALKRGVPVLLAFSHRLGRKHRIHVEQLWDGRGPLPGCDEEARANERQQDPVDAQTRAVRGLLQLANARIEAAIRSHPEQWVWLHRRWRRSPSSVGAPTAAPQGAHV